MKQDHQPGKQLSIHQLRDLFSAVPLAGVKIVTANGSNGATADSRTERGQGCPMPLGFEEEKAVSVPEGHPIIAQRFSVGFGVRQDESRRDD